MKHKRISTFGLAFLLGVFSGAPTLADDTDIYLGTSQAAVGVRPNILFILDTSGSMDAIVTGTGKDRLDNMKEAFDSIVSSVNNVNIGLMRFTDPGGPILFPVSYVDEDVSVIEGTTSSSTGFDVNVRVSASDDDAEEDYTGSVAGAVNIASTNLEMSELSTSAAANTVLTRTVSSQSNNAEEDIDSGDVDTGNRIDMRSSQINAVRFENIDLPAGAVVSDVRIVFTARDDDVNDEDVDLRFYGELNADPLAFTECDDGCKNVSNRVKTDEFVNWTPPTWDNNQSDAETTTPNLKLIWDEIVADTTWTPGVGKSMVFIQTHVNDTRRGADTFDGGDPARLEVTYSVTASTSTQLTGLRFQNVGIPKDATINNAVIEFGPTAINSEAVNLRIHGELSDDAAAFTATNGNLSSRISTTPANNVTWDPGTWGDVTTAQTTVDLTSVVQNIVNQTNWCGNNAMAFIVEAAGSLGPRVAASFDGDPSRSPVLKVDFDQDNVPANACINQFVQRQVPGSSDDAEQDGSTMNLTSSDIDIESGQTNGWRFTGLPISRNQTILEARLILTARENDTAAASIRFRAENIGDAPRFSTDNNDITDRSLTTIATAVDWSPTDWTAGTQYTSPDLKAVIQEVVNHTDWAPDNDIAIIQTHTSGTNRRAVTQDHDPLTAARLVIKVAGRLSTGGTGFKTVRTRLKEIVDGFNHRGHTPIVDTLYEAARYYRGEGVKWGARRGYDRTPWPPTGIIGTEPNASDTNTGVRENTKVSHPASYTGGTVSRATGCTDANLNANACITEQITGTPVYKTPITEECQATNYIVLLTDGSANHNHSNQLILDDIVDDKTSCDTASGDELCGRDLARYLAENDQNSTLAGDQKVVTYTVGFDLGTNSTAVTFLEDLASASGGRFSEAKDAAQLTAVFQQFIFDILSRTSSFAAPSLSVNAFNKLFHNDEVYFSLFKPETTRRWNGNVKRYRVCDDSTNCTVGEILDNSNPSQVAIGTDNRIKDGARSWWLPSAADADGIHTTSGGAALQVPAHASRRVFTDAGLAARPGSYEDLTLGTDHLLNTTNIDTGPSTGVLTKTMFGDATMSDADLQNLINWVRGQDVQDEDDDASTADRYSFGDPLHSSPVPVTYGEDASDAANPIPIVKLFIGTNDGGLRMINGHTGVEEFVFYPEVMLRHQQELMTNAGGSHIYGLDITPTPWVQDVDNDGKIEPNDGDFVRIIVGMRRGGTNYYALDVTPTATQTSASTSTGVNPKFMWRIESSAEFPRLGQTWSKPLITKIEYKTASGTSAKSVMMFGGGYNESLDSGFAQSVSEGNAVFIADPTNGTRIWWASNNNGASTANLKLTGMDYAIPSDLAVMDSNGDGMTDRIYVGDTGGQLWRIDLDDIGDGDPAAPINGSSGGARLAILSDPTAATAAPKRRFFHAPDVVRLRDSFHSGQARYDMVAIVSGDRPNPTDKDTENYIFAVRDYHTNSKISGSYTPATVADLYDTTANLIQEGDQAQRDTAVGNLRTSAGWYIQLKEPATSTWIGEKGLSRPSILSGKLFLTTYVPKGSTTVSTGCAPVEGNGRLYAMDIRNGAALFNHHSTNAALTKEDRVESLGAGIPTDPLALFTPDGVRLLVGTSGGIHTLDPDIELPRDRTYWYEKN